MAAEADRLAALRLRFWNAINDIPEVHINGDRDQRLPGALNVSFAFVEGESLIMSLQGPGDIQRVRLHLGKSRAVVCLASTRVER